MSRYFEADDLRSLIREALAARGMSARKLALATRIHPAYVSRVMQGRAHFSQDQLFSIGAAFELTSEEARYPRLMGLYEASSLDALRRTLKNEMEALQLKHLEISRRLDGARTRLISEDAGPSASSLYYGSVITAKVHMLLTMRRYQLEPDRLTSVLGISKKRLNAEILGLTRLGMVERKGTSIKVTTAAVHLEEAHPLIRQNHINWRLDAVQHLTTRAEISANPGELHLSVVFSANKNLKNTARKKFQEFVVWLKEQVDADARSDREEELGVVLFDLY